MRTNAFQHLASSIYRRAPRCAVAALACLCLSGTAYGQQTQRQNFLQSLEPEALIVMSGQSRGKILLELRKTIKKIDRDQDGLTREDLAKFDSQKETQARASKVRKLMQYDQNGDGSITHEEAVRIARMIHKYPPTGEADNRVQKAVDNAVAQVMESDLNGDRIITFDEMRDLSSNKQRKNKHAPFVEMLFKKDPNKDGRITNDELTIIVDQIFKPLDKDGDGRVDPEVQKAYAMRFLALADKKTQSCKLPKPSTDEHVIVFGASRGAAISTVAAGGPDNVTTTGKLVIEAGTKPLYVVLTSANGMIWRLQGETSRVSRVAVIVTSRIPNEASGVIGVEKSKLFFAEKNTCPGYMPGFRKPIEAQRRAAFEHILGRPADDYTGTLRLETGYLTSGKVDKTELDDATREELAKDLVNGSFKIIYPLGVAEIDPASVVAEGAVERYSILPSFAGLQKLLQDGAIEVRGDARNRLIKVVKPIERFPAGFVNGRFATFYLAPGIPMPENNTVYPCVISEETGKPVEKSSRCRTMKR